MWKRVDGRQKFSMELLFRHVLQASEIWAVFTDVKGSMTLQVRPFEPVFSVFVVSKSDYTVGIDVLYACASPSQKCPRGFF